MILDTIQHCHRYYNVHPGFREAFTFLQQFTGEDFTPRRFELNGPKLIAIVEATQGRTRPGARLEAHRKYIDIQYTFGGEEEIGWRPQSDCKHITEPYSAERDIEFYSDSSQIWLPIPAGSFAIFFPDDAHAPLATEQHVRKLIMKIAIAQ